MAAAFSLATNLVSALVAPEWLAANALWLWLLFGGLFVATIVLVVLQLRSSARQAQQDAEERRASVVNDLPLDIPRDVAASKSPSALLNVDRCVCEFRGRDAETKRLKEWCTSPDEPSFFVLTGASLVGKTRLTIHAAERLSGTWRTSRLQPGAGAGAVGRILAVPGKHLVVVELGEARDGVIEFLDEVVTRGSSRLRVILVARNYEWVLRRTGGVSELTAEVIKSGARLELRPQGTTGDLTRWATKASSAFAGLLRDHPARKTRPLKFAEGTPIGVVHAYALAHVLTTEMPAPEEASTGVFTVLAEQEMRHWDALPQTPPGSDLPRRCVAAVWLLGARDRNSIHKALRQVPELHDASAERIRQVSDWLLGTYPGTGPHALALPLEALTHAVAVPPLIEDAALCYALVRDLDLLDLVGAASRLLSAAERYAEALTRAENLLAQDDKPIDADALRIVVIRAPASRLTDELLAEVLTRNPPDRRAIDEILTELDKLDLPHASLVANQLLVQYRYEDHADEHQLAIAIGSLGDSWTDLGDYQRASGCRQRVVDLYRVLVKEASGHHTADLAEALRSLGSTLWSLGRYDEALTHHEEALHLYRDLAHTNPTKHTDNLARALRSLGNTLWSLGRYDEALTHDEEALHLYRDLAHTNPTRYTNDLASGLGNLGGTLWSLGRYDEALTHHEEALHLYRDLAHTNPARYTSDLASALENLGGTLRDLGRYDEALTHHEEALHLYRDLAHTNPTRYTNDLASGLGNLGGTLWSLGRYDQALTHAEEALHLYRDLAHTNPTRYANDLAQARQNLMTSLRALGREDEFVRYDLQDSANSTGGASE
ncbi:MAG: tetratricopeptide repeat protein [Micropruina sp.]|uniref:tetratricopeptide repeat protein n=1 Tax=Micropruina sp. TaxID=2737536 RepID=UPI0039E53D85